MKTLLRSCLLLLVASACLAQRPFYAGSRPYSPFDEPELANRFDDSDTNSSTVGTANRVGEDGQPLPTSSTTTERLPIDALGQKELIDRIKTWPREKWPFWYVNYVAIEEHRLRPVAGGGPINTGGAPSFVQQIADQQNRLNQARLNATNNLENGDAASGVPTQRPLVNPTPQRPLVNPTPQRPVETPTRRPLESPTRRPLESPTPRPLETPTLRPVVAGSRPNNLQSRYEGSDLSGSSSSNNLNRQRWSQQNWNARDWQQRQNLAQNANQPTPTTARTGRV